MKKHQQDIQALATLDVDKHVRKKKGRCEEDVKIKIVLRLLELLGYDQQQDMQFEHHIADKRADIALLVDGKPKLFVECKDLDENLDDHIHQALNYAFGKGVEWVILTNGIEFRVYKSFIPGIPDEDRCIFTTTLSALTTEFDELFALVSKDSLCDAKKLTDKADSVRERVTVKNLIEDLTECRERLSNDLLFQLKESYETDEKFKSKIDAWAKHVKMNIEDPDLVEKLCREGAYTLINRILFLRICEDKGHIKAKLSHDAISQWKHMIEDPSNLLSVAFREIGVQFEGLYQAPLFDAIHFEDISWDKNTIDFILDKLGEHDFSQISKDILGQAYEQHISKEERKELGQFYTPDAVVDYILDSVEISNSQKILDPACGSGGFLIRAYYRLQSQYQKEDWSEELIHKRILEDNLYGIDINPFATQLTVMNLLLKDLDHPTEVLNIVEGDSLDKTLDNALDFDIFQTDSPVAKVTSGGKKASLVKLLGKRPFNIIVANPPYGYRGIITEDKKKFFRRNYPDIFKGSYDLYQFFLMRAIELLDNGGKFGFIVPNTFMSKPSSIKLREFLLSNTKIKEIVELGQSAFDEPTVESVIIVAEKGLIDKDNPHEIRVKTGEVTAAKHSIQINRIATVKQSAFWQNTDYIFSLWDSDIISRIKTSTEALGDLAHITVGINTGYIRDVLVSDKKKGANFHKMLAGNEIGRYSLSWGGKWICYDPELVRSYGKQGRSLPPEWIFTEPKILVQRTMRGMKRKLNGTYDEQAYYNLNRLSNVLVQDKRISTKYVLAILNSSLMDYYFQNAFTEYEVKPYHLKKLPIKIAATDLQNELIELVDEISTLTHECEHEDSESIKKILKEKIGTADKHINDKVCELYGFVTDEDKQLFSG